MKREMMSRSLLLMLVVGILAGGTLGYVVGRFSVAPSDAGPVATVPPQATTLPAAPLSAETVAFADLNYEMMSATQCTGISKGTTRAQAIAALRARGFETWSDPAVSDHLERFRRPWRGGYHFVTVDFDGEEVVEVYDDWNDP